MSASGSGADAAAALKRVKTTDDRVPAGATASTVIGGEQLAGTAPIPGACLLIIDPQNDFHEAGSLAVAGASDDSDRTAAFLRKHAEKISNVVVTLDSHSTQHIAHSSFWEKPDDPDARPPPFSPISAEDVRTGVWQARDPALRAWTLEYTTRLEKGGRFTLFIWPEHCIIGSEGHAVRAPLREAIYDWARAKNASPIFLLKGSNNLTEMYSCFRAEVPLDGDPSTRLNAPLITALARHDKVICCGQAKSHCVNYSVRDLLEAWPADKPKASVVVLNDATSPVPTFEAAGEQFVTDMTASGVTLTTTDAF